VLYDVDIEASACILSSHYAMLCYANPDPSANPNPVPNPKPNPNLNLTLISSYLTNKH